MNGSFENWGRQGPASRPALPVDALPPTLSKRGGWLPFGNGRSYGDSCLNSGGTLIDSRRRKAIVAFDPDTGDLTAEAGVLLAEILDHVIPLGFFLPVTPGTAQVTLGGAIANDVHGKNHHRRGTFGRHVSALTLRTAGGELKICSPSQNADLFQATIGGMGLTGLIATATVRMMRVASPDIRQRTVRFDSLDRYFEMIDEVDAAHEYSVAWIDQLATGARLGHGVLMAGDHASETLPTKKRRKLSVPIAPPVNLLNRLTLQAFNELYFRKAKPGETITTVPWRSFFHPLDSIAHWNRLYGPRGLFQHQSVYPAEAAPETTARLMDCARRHGHASFLTVLKRFGTITSPAVFSFPRPGFTLTLDFANQGRPTLKLLDALDEIVIGAGGAVNPYKDARMSAATFAASFPDWARLESFREPAMMSDFWSRTAMRLDRPEMERRRSAGMLRKSEEKLKFERFSSRDFSALRRDCGAIREGSMKYLPFILFTVLTNAAAQLMLKQGMLTLNGLVAPDHIVLKLFHVVFNPWVFAGLVTFVISMASHLFVLSKVELSFAYPFLSLAYVAVAVFAFLLFREDLNAWRIAGIAFICVGTVLIARSGSGGETVATASLSEPTVQASEYSR